MLGILIREQMSIVMEKLKYKLSELRTSGVAGNRASQTLDFVK